VSGIGIGEKKGRYNQQGKKFLAKAVYEGTLFEGVVSVSSPELRLTMR
jgi:hypothetical protein